VLVSHVLVVEVTVAGHGESGRGQGQNAELADWRHVDGEQGTVDPAFNWRCDGEKAAARALRCEADQGDCYKRVTGCRWARSAMSECSGKERQQSTRTGACRGEEEGEKQEKG